MPAPVITSSATASGTMGQAFTYQTTASNTPTVYKAEYLPPALDLNEATGSIIGFTQEAGTFSVKLYAGNASGTSDAFVLTLTIAPKADVTGSTLFPAPVTQFPGPGTAATRDVGTTAGTVAAGDDSRLNFARNVRDSTYAGGAKGDGTTDDTAAIQAALTAGGHVLIPYSPSAYIISDVLVIASNTFLDIAPGVVIYETSGNNVMMLRNANPTAAGGDHDITIKGGFWDCNWTGNPGTSLFSSYLQLQSSKTSPIKGLAGVIGLVGVTRAEVTDLSVKNANSFSIQMSQCNDWRVERINFLRDQATISDGVHINGPSARFVVRDIHGQTGDDFIAVNAWDWSISTPAKVQGVIQDGYIANLRPVNSYYTAVKLCAGNGDAAAIRNLTIEDVKGSTTGCPFIWGTLGDGIDGSNTVTPGNISGITLRDVAINVNGPQTPFPYEGVFAFYGGNLSGIRITNIVIDATHKSFLGTGSNNQAWLVADANSTLADLTVDGLVMLAPNVRSSIFAFNCAVQDFRLLNSVLLSDSVNSGDQAYSIITFAGGTSSQQNVWLNNVVFNGTPGAIYNTGGSKVFAHITGCQFYGPNAGLIYQDNAAGATTIQLNGNTFTATSQPLVQCTQGTVAVFSATNLITGSAFAALSGSGMRWDGIDLPIDYQQVTASEGDWIRNSNSASGTPTGRVKRSGGAWVSL